MGAMTRAGLGALVLVAAGCQAHRESAEAALPAAREECPAMAEFINLEESGAFYGGGPGHSLEIIVVVVQGAAVVGGQPLAEGDVYLHVRPDSGALAMSGKGRVLWVDVAIRSYRWGEPVEHAQVIRAHEGPQLSWARGRMKAQLQVGQGVSKEAYVGWLEGSVGVPTHTHPKSCEIIAALEASGTFTRDEKSGRLGPGQILMVPKGVSHAWAPDPGTALRAVQLYIPPGPEQRFVELDAGDRKAK